MRFFLCRHGNTFGPDQAGGERIFMCGSKNNIPLVETGRQQARLMAEYLDKNNIIPDALYANSLIRTWEFAVLIKEYFHHKREIDIPLFKEEHLLELDYGDWAGLSTPDNTPENNEVIKRFGESAWNNWQKHRIIPNNAPHNWKVTEEEMVSNIQLFFKKIKEKYESDATILAVGSQGSLSFVNSLLEGGMKKAIEEDRFKIKTGRFIEITENNNQLKLVGWNQKPSMEKTK